MSDPIADAIARFLNEPDIEELRDAVIELTRELVGKPFGSPSKIDRLVPQIRETLDALDRATQPREQG